MVMDRGGYSGEINNENISDDIKAQLERLTSKTPEINIEEIGMGIVVYVDDGEDIYEITRIGEDSDSYEIIKGQRKFPSPKKVVIVGTTAGGSSIKTGFIRCGGFLEIGLNEELDNLIKEGVDPITAKRKSTFHTEEIRGIYTEENPEKARKLIDGCLEDETPGAEE